MLYALRDEVGAIVALSEQQLNDQWKEVDQKDSELQLFLEKKMADGQKVMQTSDIDFIRVLEDLIDLMIAKNIISFTDFPAGAQKKLLARRGYRAQIRGEAGGVSLISQEEGFL